VFAIQRAIEEEARQHGGIETWLSFLGFRDARVWQVSGEPWLEVNAQNAVAPMKTPVLTLYRI